MTGHHSDAEYFKQSRETCHEMWKQVLMKEKPCDKLIPFPTDPSLEKSVIAHYYLKHHDLLIFEKYYWIYSCQFLIKAFITGVTLSKI